MSNSHKRSRLALANQVVPVKFNTAHFNFKEDAIGIQYGEVVPTSEPPTYSLRIGEGPVGGSAIALEENSLNYAQYALSAYAPYYTYSRDNNNHTYYRQEGSTSPVLAVQCSTFTTQSTTGELYTISGFLYLNDKPFKTAVSHISTYHTGTVKRTSRDDGYFEYTQPFNTSGWIIHSNLCGAQIGDTIKIVNLQIEKKPFGTSFTNSSRGNLSLNYPIYSYKNISGWVKANYVNNGWQRIVGSYSDPIKEHWYLGVNQGTVYLVLRNKTKGTETTLTISSSEVDIRDGQWHFLSVSFDDVNKKVSLAVDSILKEVTFADTISLFPYELQFGKHIPNDAEQWNGLISDVRVDLSIISYQEISSWYESKVSYYNPYDYRGYAE